MLSLDHKPRPAPRHLVQFYGPDGGSLIANVCAYLRAGVSQGEGVLIVAATGRSASIIRGLEERGCEPDRLMREGRLAVRDAEEMLAALVKHGEPDWERFERTLAPLIRDLRARTGSAGMRVHGEIVDLLWSAGYSKAAVRLEQFWNRLQAAHRFSLFCSYQIDVFGQEFQSAVLDGLLDAHTRLLPFHADGQLHRAVGRALCDVLGSRAGEIRKRIQAARRPSRPVLPRAEAGVLWLRDNLPEYAGEILARARAHMGQGQVQMAAAENG